MTLNRSLWFGCTLLFLAACRTPTPEQENRPPVLEALEPVTLAEGTSVTVTLSASDPDGDPLAFSATDLPAFGSLSGSDLVLSPLAGNAGSYPVTIIVSDGKLSDSKSLAITVTPVNTQPVLSGAEQVDTGGQPVAPGTSVNLPPSLRATVGAAQDQNVKLDAEVVLAGAAFTGVPTHATPLSQPGTLTLSIGSLPAGSYKWQVRAVDSAGAGSPWVAFAGGNTAFIVASQMIDGTLAIAGGALATNSQTVTLTLAFTPGAGGSLTQMAFSNDGTTFTSSEPYATTRSGWQLTAGEGMKTVHARVRDSNDNEGTFVASIIYDTTPPQIGSFNVNGNADATNSLNTQLHFVVTDEGSGLQLLEASNDGTTFAAISLNSPAAWNLTPGDGMKTVTLRATDAAGNVSQLVTDTILLDQTAPTVSGVSINGGQAQTPSPNVTVSATAADANGVADIAFSSDGTNFDAFQPYVQSGNAYTLPGGDGPKSVYVQVRDPAGNVSQPAHPNASIVLDTTPPSGTVIINGGAVATNQTAVQLTLTASDAATSVAQWCAREASAAPAANDPCWQAYPPSPDPAPFTLSSGDGTKTVHAWFRDQVGNVSATAATDTILLDQTAPTLSSFELDAGAPYTNSATVTGNNTATDGAGSGLKDICLGETTPPTNCVAYSAAVSATLSAGDGTKTVYARVVDFAGNVSDILFDSIVLDQTAPVITAFAVNGGDTYATSLTVTGNHTASDALSGLDTVCLGVTSPPTDCQPYSAAPQTTLPPGEGPRTVYVQVTDTAGNSSAILSDAIIIDTVPPSGSVVINDGDTYSNSLNVNLTLTAADASSGVAAFCKKNNSTVPAASDACFVALPSPPTVAHALTAANGQKFVYVWYKDNAGLVSATLQDDIFLDTVAPPAPTGVAMVTGHRELRVTWSAADEPASGTASGHAGFEVIVTTADGTGNTTTQRIPFATKEASLTGLQNGLSHNVVVRAFDNAGNTASSAQVASTPRWPFAYQHRQPAGAPLYAVHMYTGSAGIAIGDGGAVVTTTNTWGGHARRDTLSDQPLRGLAVDDGGRTHVVGLSGHIAWSDNNGAGWRRVPNPQSPPRDLHAIAHTRTLGTVRDYVAVGDNSVLTGTRTGTDAVTFQALSNPPAAVLRAVARCASGCPTVELVAVGDGGAIYRSVDGGQSWVQETPPAGYEAVSFRAVAAVPGTDEFYAVTNDPPSGEPAVLRYAGGSWSKSHAGFSTLRAWALAVPSATAVFVVGADASGVARVMRFNGTDAPTTLTNPSGVTAPARAISALSTTALTWVGDGGQIVDTTNGGSSWFNATTGRDTTLAGASFAGGSVWVVGAGGYIARSNNNGTSWAVETTNSTTPFNGISMVSTTFGVAVAGGSDNLFRYTGALWVAEFFPALTVPLHGAYCFSGSSCWVVGAQKGIGHYNGTAWSTVNLDSGSSLAYRGVDGYLTGGSERLVVVGDAGELRRYNAGTWTSGVVAGQPALRAAGAKRDGSGRVFAVGSGGAVYLSTDHGDTWNPASIPGVTGDLTGVRHVAGTSTWYATGAGGVVLKSTDDGASWVGLISSASAPLLNGFAINATGTSIWAVGARGLVLHSATSGE